MHHRELAGDDKEACSNMFSRQCVHSLGQAPFFAAEIRFCIVLSHVLGDRLQLIVSSGINRASATTYSSDQAASKPELASSKTISEHQATIEMGPRGHHTNKI